MTTTTEKPDTLTELATRIEQAEGPSRELDAAVFAALGNCNHKRTEYYFIEDGNDYDSGHTCLDCGKDTYGAKKAPTYTASLDAAMTLVPEGWGFTLVAVPGQGADGTVREWKPDKDGKFWTGNDMARAEVKRAANPALALCAAALRAQGGS